ncbi:hypothetical protein LTS18_011636 [Coniosporium uncinatum]|uniref:Uncharacterized protein n=1 Tax=Coniosporium uncinatum TaxID=93489 RepID=A0ACC3DJZ0_9PEZI|nr:hypothetical protein LTS18_011636 [Coniosporium uncinatum]
MVDLGLGFTRMLSTTRAAGFVGVGVGELLGGWVSQGRGQGSVVRGWEEMLRELVEYANREEEEEEEEEEEA